MGKLGGGSGIGHLWMCSKTPDTFYGFADMLPSNICAYLSQHALTTFQSGIISPSSSVSLLCPICAHFSPTSPNWFHSNTMRSCLTPAFLSFTSLHPLLSKSIFTLLSLFVTLCSDRHLWLFLSCALWSFCMHTCESTGIFCYACE